MHITVSLHGVLRIDRFKREIRSYPVGSCVQNIIEDLKISPILLGIILINEVHANSDSLLHDGDTLMLLPLLEGG